MFHGSMVALVTPMRDDGAIDDQSFAQLVEFHVENGTDALVVVGTTGESATLDHKEHCDLIRRAVELAGGRVPIIAGTGANSTREAIDLTRCAMQAGADACLLVTPYYNKPTQEGIYQHFKAVAEAVAIPQILYNVPGRTACDMLNDTVERLASISNIVGIKDATGDMVRGKELIERCGDKINVFSGDDATTLDLMRLGGKGGISVTANVAPREMHEMCAAALSGDFTRAGEINDRLMPVHKKLFVEANPIPVKWAMYEMGLIPSGIRLPLTLLSEKYHDTVRQALKASGVL
jgi:4-hydroxy-tetrahydrodipicolinate synthase